MGSLLIACSPSVVVRVRLALLFTMCNFLAESQVNSRIYRSVFVRLIVPQFT